MSILGKIEGFISGVGSIPGEVLHGLESAWNSIKAVWSFLVSISGVLSDAWTWVVNGVGWFADQVAGWASEVYNTLWNTLTATIPEAIAWVFNQAVKWAAAALAKVYGELRHVITAIYEYLVRLMHDLVNAVKALLQDFIRWATGPVRWVLHWGAWLINLITHPEHLANWIAGAILEPVVKWLLSSGADVIVWALRSSIRKNSGFAHLIEQVLHDLL